MNKKQIINKYLKDCSNDTILVEKIITKIYLDENKIDFTKSKFLFNYLSAIDDDLYRLLHEYSKKIDLKFTLNDLIEFFELLIPSAEKKMNGMVYTPYNIKRYMIDMAFKGINDISDNLAICDPSCGCGSFLVSVAQYMHDKYGLSFSSIVNEHLYGVDIFEHNIEKAKVLFNILSLENGELLECSFNLYAFDSMVMDWEKCFDVVFQNGGFDIVIGNPPYVSAKNMSESTRTSLKNWKTAQHGKVDLYIPFYELGLNILRENGDLFFITINTFLKSINARGFRNLIIKSGYEIEVIDFSASQMFKDILSYTAITMIHKGQTNHSIKYVNYKSTDIDALENVEFSMYNSNEYEENEPWYLVNSSDIMHLEKLKQFPVTLKEYNIKNGLATLRNDIYFFTPIKETTEYYIRIFENVEYEIEKGICIDIIKPNVLRSEADIQTMVEKAIFPYNKTNNFSVLGDEYFRKNYPKAYLFLEGFKAELSKRDKGDKKYPEWYAYGRTQGFRNQGTKLLIPYISDSPRAIISLDEELLFYSGYALFVEDEREALFMKKILESSVFALFIKLTSKPYSHGYYSYAKSYLAPFSIPNFNEQEKEEILQSKSQQEADKILEKIYGVDLYE